MCATPPHCYFFNKLSLVAFIKSCFERIPKKNSRNFALDQKQYTIMKGKYICDMVLDKQEFSDFL